VRLSPNLRGKPRVDPLHCRRCFIAAKPGCKFPGVDRACRTHTEQDLLTSYMREHGSARQEVVA
jgi:predicted metal-binding protein